MIIIYCTATIKPKGEKALKKFKKFGIILLAGACAATTALGLAACAGDEVPNIQNGTSTTLVTNKSPDELTPENAIYAFLQKQSEFVSYKITAEGTAVASLAGYEQDIHNITYKSGGDYLNSASSDSFLVKMKHQSFSKNGKVVYRNDFEGEMQVAEKEAYKKVYGFTADDITLGGYIINAKTLRYVTLEKTEGDTFTYYMRLAGDQSVESGSATESATTGIRLQSKAYGSLDNLPSYSDVDMRLTIKKDWTPVSYVSSCSYDAKKLFNMTVEQQIVSTYSDVNGQVDIPDVEAFNQMLGTAPSVVTPAQNGPDALTQLTTALGNTMDEKGTVALPFTIGVQTDGSAATLNGDLTLKLKEDALNSGAFADALTARLDIDLAKLPLVSGIANTLTVRYPGDGVLLIILHNKTADGDTPVFTYTADLNGAFGSLNAGASSMEDLQSALDEYLSLEKTATGFTVALKDAAVTKLNEAFGGMLEALGTKLGDTNGYIDALLGVTFTGAKAQLTLEKTAETEKISGIAVLAEIQPSENVTLGEKIAVSLDTKLMNGALAQPFTGDLEIRPNLAAILAGDYYASVKAHLHLDLTPASNLMSLLGFVGGMMPDIPSWLNANLSSLDVYYTGNGILTIAFNNAEGLPMGMTEVDLKETISQKLPASGGTTSEPGTTQPTFSLLPFTLTVSENGLKLALGEPAVKAIAAAYNGLVESLIAKASENDTTGLAGAFLGPWLRAEITGVEFFLGTTDEGKLTFDLAIIATYQNANYAPENGRFIGLTITDKQTLTSEESADLVADKALKELKAANEKALGYAERLQEFIDGMDVTEEGYQSYVNDVIALQDEINGQAPAVKTLISNGSYLAEKTYKDKQYSVLLLTAQLYYERATEFKAKFTAIAGSSKDSDWDDLNAIYDKPVTVEGIQVPAIKEDSVLKAAVGTDTIDDYLPQRKAHETKLAEELKAEIYTAEAAFDAAKDRTGWTNALTAIVTEFKSVYDKLSEDLKETTGYLAFVKKVYIKNVEELVNVYKGLENEVHALTAQPEGVSIDGILAVMKKVAEANAWGFGYDYWVANTATVIQPWGKTWLTALKPTDLSAEEQAKVNELNTLNRSFLKGNIAQEILESYAELVKTEVETLYSAIKDCRIVVDGTDQWNFDGLAGDKDEVLERIHGIRFLICKVLTTDLFNDWEDETLLQFARIDLTKYETALMGYLATKE